MKRRVLARKWLAVMLALGGLAAASAQDALSTAERQALLPRAANRTVRRDLLSIFKPVEKIRPGMFRRLRGVDLATQAWETVYEGVCQRDTIWLHYTSSEDGPKPEDDPVEPYGISAGSSFHVIALSPNARARGAPVLRQPRCLAADRDRDANWFGAKNVSVAVRGVLVLRAALDAVKAGTLKSAPCEYTTKPAISCEADILASGDPDTIDTIDDCSSEDDVACFIINLGQSTKLTIKARMAYDDLAPKSVTSIAIEHYVIVT